MGFRQALLARSENRRHQIQPIRKVAHGSMSQSRGTRAATRPILSFERASSSHYEDARPQPQNFVFAFTSSLKVKSASPPSRDWRRLCRLEIEVIARCLESLLSQ